MKGRQPFYVQITPNAPHEPLQVRPEDEQRYAGKVDPKVAKFFGMIANIDDNVGRLLAQLKEWGLEENTLVIFMNDNGGTAGIPIFNAGMRGQKGTPWLGGTRASSFWRWPGKLQSAEVSALTGHVDFFPHSGGASRRPAFARSSGPSGRPQPRAAAAKCWCPLA